MLLMIFVLALAALPLGKIKISLRYTVFRARRITFFLVRVVCKKKKLIFCISEPGSGGVWHQTLLLSLKIKNEHLFENNFSADITSWGWGLFFQRIPLHKIVFKICSPCHNQFSICKNWRFFVFCFDVRRLRVHHKLHKKQFILLKKRGVKPVTKTQNVTWMC